MDPELRLRMILEAPPAGIDFGLQKGKGSNYETIQVQHSTLNNLVFEFAILVKASNNSQPDFKGPFVQGSVGERFVYIDIGTYAGQKDTAWSRRLKIPLKGITTDMIDKVLHDSSQVLVTRVAGTGKDGGPNCATVKPFAGWQVEDNDS